ncbi:Ger(x)C family spore germination protein [Brevibacillus choshinensis]|uniref:Ger(x)C family spore germination protein n=1 Tax=Brevibacillus choshinensis TaxID=54911 RepID=UPI002E2119DB|nr:Ger(x)C family spore germination protein [Brevibacillus choshinensis]MED4751877.1 Ger(x)C family spore germination protein [Brevibacillus choshinensis]MED4784380.1 Ger(x)C family spore germination protein [Brevibacillus choshinensis]
MTPNHRPKRLPLAFLCVILLVSLTACWSSNDIDKMGVGVGLALDLAHPSPVEQELEKKGGGYPKTDKITLTYQFINPKSSGKEGNSTGPQQKAYLNVTDTGDSLHQITREFALREDGPIYSPHLKVIVISEALSKAYRLDHLLDLYLRDNYVRPSCLVFISKDKALDTLESKKQGELPALHLLGISDNEDRTNRLIPSVSLARLTTNMNSGSSFLLQNLVSSEKEVKFAGAAVIKGRTKKWEGFLDERDLEGITWITGKGKGGVVKSFDKKTGQLLVYEIKTMDSTITPKVDGDKISFEVTIESEGRLSEKWVTSGDPFEQGFLKKVEQTTEAEVLQLVKSVTNKIQKQFKADVAGFGNRLRIEYPRTWEQVKKDWDHTFSTVPITYSVHLTITDFGASGQMKK